MSDCHETKSKHIDWTLGLKCDHWVWPWSWPWPWIFKVEYEICYISAKKMFRLSRNEKQTYRLNSRPQMWSSGLTMAMTLTLNFKGRYGICYISTKMVRLPRNEKQTYPLISSTSNATNGFDHGLDLWIFKVKCDLDLWPHTWPWPWIFMVTFWNSCFSEWEGRLTLNKVGGSRSFMTVTVTIWWPKSGVKIYQIVTSVIGVLSTHLVGLDNDLAPVRPQVSILTNDFSLITPQSTDFNEKMLKLKPNFIDKIALLIIVRNFAAISPGGDELTNSCGFMRFMALCPKLSWPPLEANG